MSILCKIHHSVPLAGKWDERSPHFTCLHFFKNKRFRRGFRLPAQIQFETGWLFCGLNSRKSHGMKPPLQPGFKNIRSNTSQREQLQTHRSRTQNFVWIERQYMLRHTYCLWPSAAAVCPNDITTLLDDASAPTTLVGFKKESNWN